MTGSAFHVGAFTKIYDPSVGEKEHWYINDHTFIRAEDGQWHLFGITHKEPAKAMEEKFFAHATAPSLLGPWTKQASVLPVDSSQGETVVWAPYALRHKGVYYMFYCGGGKEHTKYHIHLATSVDLFHWKRNPANPMVVDGYDARDPMVIEHEGQWILYYAATSTPKGGNHTVKSATSPDLVHWSHQPKCFAMPKPARMEGRLNRHLWWRETENIIYSSAPTTDTTKRQSMRATTLFIGTLIEWWENSPRTLPK